MLWLDAHNRLGKVVAAEVGVAQSRPTLATPWTGARQAPLSMGFSRQGYWSGEPFVVFGICTQFFCLVSHLYWVEWSPPTWKCDSCSECDFMWQLGLCRCNS